MTRLRKSAILGLLLFFAFVAPFLAADAQVVRSAATPRFAVASIRPAATARFPEPLVIPTANLRLWLAADEGLTYTDGQEVLLWSDQSAQGNDVTVSAGSGPTFNSTFTINGLPTVDFSPSCNKLLSRTANNLFATPGSARTVYVAGQVDPLDTALCPTTILQDRRTGTQFVAQVLASSIYVYTDAVSVNTTLVDTTLCTDARANPFTAMIQSPGAGGKIVFRFNGVTRTNSSNPNVVTESGGTGFQIGYRNGVGQGWCDYLGEVIVYEEAHDASEIANVEAYLQERWGTP